MQNKIVFNMMACRVCMFCCYCVLLFNKRFGKFVVGFNDWKHCASISDHCEAARIFFKRSSDFSNSLLAKQIMMKRITDKTDSKCLFVFFHLAV